MRFGLRYVVNQTWSAASPEDAGNAGHVVGVCRYHPLKPRGMGASMHEGKVTADNDGP